MQIVLCPDKFRGSATAAEVVRAWQRPLETRGHEVVGRPMADGGEGTLEALGGANRRTLVTGPLGEAVDAEWRLSSGTAVIEMARASGLLLAGGAEGNDPLTATTSGTGELIAEAMAAGAKRIIIGVGGSATTDGGLGAIRAMEPLARFKGVELLVACDVRTQFVDAARVFGPQKGASAAQIQLLTRRLERLSEVYEEQFGVAVAGLDRAGAAGGLGGGLAAVGGQLVEGFELISDEVELVDAIEAADLVVTGEGALDAESFDGKVVGGVVELAREFGVRCAVIAGQIDADAGVPDGVVVRSLVERFGLDSAMGSTAECLATAMVEVIEALEGDG